MTIHHDKLAYGKLASNMEELPEEKLNEMLKLLSAEEELPEEKEKNNSDRNEEKND